MFWLYLIVFLFLGVVFNFVFKSSVFFFYICSNFAYQLYNYSVIFFCSLFFIFQVSFFGVFLLLLFLVSFFYSCLDLCLAYQVARRTIGNDFKSGISSLDTSSCADSSTCIARASQLAQKLKLHVILGPALAWELKTVPALELEPVLEPAVALNPTPEKEVISLLTSTSCSSTFRAGDNSRTRPRMNLGTRANFCTSSRDRARGSYTATANSNMSCCISYKLSISSRSRASISSRSSIISITNAQTRSGISAKVRVSPEL